MIITNNLIDLDVNYKTRDEIIKHLAGLAFKEGRIKDLNTYINSVLKREEEYSTAIGFNVAIPHGKTDAVKDPFLAFAKVQDVDWKALDNEPVNLVFLIGVPKESAGTLHLKILAALSRKIMKKEFRVELMAAKNPEDILTLLKGSDIGI